MDDQIRRAMRERDSKPDDIDAAIDAARLVARAASRERAADAWQEVLKRDRLNDTARDELVALGCDLFWRGKNDEGYEEYENSLDSAVLVKIPGGTTILCHPQGRRTTIDPFFVAKEPVTYAQYQQFLVRNPSVAKEEVDGWINLAHGPLRRGALGSYKLRNEARASYVVEVSWFGARAYARWARGDLPSGAQWELFTLGAQTSAPAAATLPKSSAYGVTGGAALGTLGGEWTLDETTTLGIEHGRIVRGDFSRITGASPLSSVTPLPPRTHAQSGFRYVRATWWKT